MTLALDSQQVPSDASRPWFDGLTRHFPGLELVRGDGRDGAFERHELGPAELWVIAAHNHAIRHRLPATCLRERVSVVLQVEGEGRVAQAGHACELRPGDLTLIEGSAPMNVEFDGPYRQCLLLLPRRGVTDLPIAEAAGRAMRGEDPVDGLLGRAIAGLPDAVARLGPVGRGELAASLGLMLRTTSALQRGREAVRRHVRVERAIALIERELADPELSPARVAAGQGVGRRHLDALFAAHGGSIERWIQERRLQRAAQALRVSRESVLEVAVAHGFRSASHFARAFRRRFGAVPSAWRGEPTGGGS
ncbi:helix-turn-helix domain-containing protein [Nannocystis punicea]|uniref:Helix-turn-helix domain-containing protein n=1 Tax=Nannocystis punicea TaxID=2995304 RepID=A0ABY7GS15_9BACT|nr:helix-turn-helix domain-containing protein [Nannocystis poenicansa]WAS89759.1 helix-turn-helix domain-containing protein [Nannocystis poenicansa]